MWLYTRREMQEYCYKLAMSGYIGWIGPQGNGQGENITAVFCFEWRGN